MAAVRELLLKDKKMDADIFLNKAKVIASKTKNEEYLAETAYYMDEFSLAEKEYRKLNKNNPNDIEYLGKLAICNFIVGNHPEAIKDLKNLELLRKDDNFGELDYVLAQYYAIANDEEAMYQHLLKSVASGHFFFSKNFSK